MPGFMAEEKSVPVRITLTIQIRSTITRGDPRVAIRVIFYFRPLCHDQSRRQLPLPGNRLTQRSRRAARRRQISSFRPEILT
jgi:hypothetical protein